MTIKGGTTMTTATDTIFEEALCSICFGPALRLKSATWTDNICDECDAHAEREYAAQGGQ
jgi:hypothetical protein